MWLLRLNAFIVTVVKRFLKREKHGGHPKLTYTNTYGRMVEYRMEQLMGNVGVFVGFCGDVELVVRLVVVLVNVVRLRSEVSIYSTIYERWIAKFVCTAQRVIHVWYLGDIRK